MRVEIGLGFMPQYLDTKSNAFQVSGLPGLLFQLRSKCPDFWSKNNTIQFQIINDKDDCCYLDDCSEMDNVSLVFQYQTLLIIATTNTASEVETHT